MLQREKSSYSSMKATSQSPIHKVLSEQNQGQRQHGPMGFTNNCRKSDLSEIKSEEKKYLYFYKFEKH